MVTIVCTATTMLLISTCDTDWCYDETSAADMMLFSDTTSMWHTMVTVSASAQWYSTAASS